MIVRRFWPTSGWQSPFSELDRMRREMERVFEDLTGMRSQLPAAGVFPPVNVTQDRERFYVRAEIPGVKPSDVELTAAHNTVSIAGQRTIPREGEKVSYHRRERDEGSFRRTITLPHEFQGQNIEARHVNGVLTIVLPKAEAAKPRQITVKAS